MNFNDVYNRFKLISSLTDEEISQWVSVITEAMDFVSSLVTKQNLTEFDIKRLNNASAVFAYRRYILYTINKEKSFRAGDVTVSINRDVAEDVENMWKRELDSLCDLISPSFIFRRVM